MNRRPRSRSSLLAIAAIALLVAAGCGGDDDTAANSDGGAPTSSGVAAPVDDDDPLAAAVGGWFAEYKVAEAREAGDTLVFVMDEGATDEDVTRLCEDLSVRTEQAVATEVDGTVTPCP